MRKEIYSDYAIILNVADGTFTELTFLESYGKLNTSPDLSVISQGLQTEYGILNNFYTRRGDLLLSTRSESGRYVQCISSNNKYAVFLHEGSYDVNSFSVIEIATGKITYGQTEDDIPSAPPDITPGMYLGEKYLGDWFPAVGENQFWTAFKNTQEII